MSGEHAFVVVAYGDSPYLAGCLASLKAQTRRSRILVATSTPSPHIEAEARVAGADLVVNPERRGIGADWNFALRAASAAYVTLAHQDDLYEPTFTAVTMDLFEGHPSSVLCFTGYDEIDDAGRPKSSKLSRVKHLIEAATLGDRILAHGWRLRMFLSFGNPLPCSSVTFDRTQLSDFYFSDDYSSNLDWEAWWRLHRQGRTFLHAPQRLVGRRHNDLTETSRLIRDGRRQAEDAAMFARIWPKPIDRAIASVYAASYR